jgi:hypothetical protein
MPDPSTNHTPIMEEPMKTISFLRLAVLTAVVLALPAATWAHCDTMNGPVVKAGRQALESGDIRYALVWVRQADEPEIRSAFERALHVRTLGSDAKELADRYFFETLVRVHRAAEGAPYTGLKDEELEPGIAAAEEALEARSVKSLSQELGAALQHGLSESFQNVQRAGKPALADVDAGRRYVASYVSFIHYVESLHKAIEISPDSHTGHNH